MAEITAQLVKELREKTSAGMMDCKKALKETDGDITTAIEWLRKKGITSAEKKAGRVTAEGLVETYINPEQKIGVLIEVNCQTDFVARNEAFKILVKNLAQQAITVNTVEELLSQPYVEKNTISVDEFIKETIATLGENIQIRRFVKFDLENKAGCIDSYIHTGGRVGVLLELIAENSATAEKSEFQELAKNAAMQVAACPNVEFVSKNEISAEVVEKEKQIEMGREDLANKPDNIKEKIVEGRIDKRLGELCLLSQPYIRDQGITVEELIKQTVKTLGDNIEITRFNRFILGEGIEKKESNFAEEVAAQTGGLI